MNKLAQVDIGISFGSPFGQGKTIGDLISLVLTTSLTVAGIIVLFLFALAGFQLIMSAGQNNPESASKAKQAATSGAIGFVIIFVAYWIIRIIEIISGSDFITAPGL